MSTMVNLPVNPEPGMVVQINEGLYVQYDAGTQSWLKVIITGALGLATTFRDGTMAATDFKKLNRMLMPPPTSTIKGADCSSKLKPGAGNISLTGQSFMTISGESMITNMAGSIGTKNIEKRIHQNTSAFDFDLDIDNLVQYLVDIGKITLGERGPAGDKGDTGPKGDPGSAGGVVIKTGPRGIQGDPGGNVPCTVSIETENFDAKLMPGSNKVAVDARFSKVGNDYVLVVDRKTATTSEGTDVLNVKTTKSPWLLAVANPDGGAQDIYYIDVDDITNAIYDKYLLEVERLKKSYEAVVEFWLKTMSTMFDEQKQALCCAIEYCESQIKNAEARRHLETISASIADKDLKLTVRKRGDEDAEVVAAGPNCSNEGNTQDAILDPPSYNIYNYESAIDKTIDGSIQSLSIQSAGDEAFEVDALLNSGSSERGTTVSLQKGEYVLTIKDNTVEYDGLYMMPLRIIYNHAQSGRTVTRFLDQGAFDSLVESQGAYEGLSINIIHEGGPLIAYFAVMPTGNCSGKTIVAVKKVVEAYVPMSDSYEIEADILRKVAVSGGGVLFRSPNQDYIVSRIWTDELEGDKEYSVAWPTLDGKTFVEIPEDGVIRFKKNAALSALIKSQIGDRLGITLFPIYEAQNR